jgi:hypothetical protein
VFVESEDPSAWSNTDSRGKVKTYFDQPWTEHLRRPGEILSDLTKAHGNEHPEALEMTNLVGRGLRYFKQYDIAIPSLLRSLTIGQLTTLGREHPLSLMMSSLAECYLDVGESRKSLGLSEEGWDIAVATFGKDSDFDAFKYSELLLRSK